VFLRLAADAEAHSHLSQQPPAARLGLPGPGTGTRDDEAALASSAEPDTTA
jgi:hypothetical protein